MRIETTESWFGAATLESLIAALEKCPPNSTVEYSFCCMAPTKIRSYRGYYEFAALGWTDVRETPPTTVAKCVETLRSSIGQRMTGYKGGEYIICTGKPLFVDNQGDASGTGIIAVETDEEENGYTILVTAKVD